MRHARTNNLKGISAELWKITTALGKVKASDRMRNWEENFEGRLVAGSHAPDKPKKMYSDA